MSMAQSPESPKFSELAKGTAELIYGANAPHFSYSILNLGEVMDSLKLKKYGTFLLFFVLEL